MGGLFSPNLYGGIVIVLNCYRVALQVSMQVSMQDHVHPVLGFRNICVASCKDVTLPFPCSGGRGLREAKKVLDLPNVENR